jgi:hypothetical protein
MSSPSVTETGVEYLLPLGTEIETSGQGAAFALGALRAKPVLIVLRVQDVIEQEYLHVSIWGSADGRNWGDKALFWFPQVFYRGATPAALNLQQRPEVQFLQARWEVGRWGRGYPRPYFKAGIEIQELTNP